MKVLGIETSCDETAAAVVASDRRILSNVVRGQGAAHAPYGGVVPEVAARAHAQHIDGVVRRALDAAGCGLEGIDAVAATCGPGLIGGVMVGMMVGKAIAAARGLPFVAVNHLEAHALTARLTAPALAFPYLVLLVSGGHTQILEVRGPGAYRLLGQTLDDAAGECLDKAAKAMGLGTGGGAAVEALAREAADAGGIELPRPMVGRAGCDFSFSGLKTAVRQAAHDRPQTRAAMAPLARALQDAVAEILADRCSNALRVSGLRTLVVAGGVAANEAIRAALEALPVQFVAPPPALCGDNAAMVAWAGIERLAAGLPPDGLDAPARPRWPLAGDA
jgi:N6-L-threonylcarbamoyladenine synthase